MRLVTFICVLATGLFSVSALAALYARGDGMIYDDVLDITWLLDANYSKTSGYHATGMMTWSEANIWATGLDYGGHDDWRLASPNTSSDTCISFTYDANCFAGYNNYSGELGHMYHYNLNNSSNYDTDGNKISRYYGFATTFVDASSGLTRNFNNIGSSYWYGDAENGLAWLFFFPRGLQYTISTDNYTSRFSWAVRDGDVQVVPVPAAGYLFLSALIGLMGRKWLDRR